MLAALGRVAEVDGTGYAVVALAVDGIKIAATGCLTSIRGTAHVVIT
jgi:hypothetical protein